MDLELQDYQTLTRTIGNQIDHMPLLAQNARDIGASGDVIFDHKYFHNALYSALRSPLHPACALQFCIVRAGCPVTFAPHLGFNRNQMHARCKKGLTMTSLLSKSAPIALAAALALSPMLAPTAAFAVPAGEYGDLVEQVGELAMTDRTGIAIQT